jgi:hypothetical protein
MCSSVTIGSAGQRHVREFRAAALLTSTRVRTVRAEELCNFLPSYGSGGDALDLGYSTDLRQILHIGSGQPVNARPPTWISRAQVGISSTGTVLVAERLAEDRISALLCTRHIVVLPSHRLVRTQTEAAGDVRSCLRRGLSYVTFVSGPSRTSDIEKVLTLGAHGPAELEVVLVDGWNVDDD